MDISVTIQVIEMRFSVCYHNILLKVCVTQNLILVLVLI